MADKKAKIKKLKTPVGVLAAMQCAHLGKIISVVGIGSTIFLGLSLLGGILGPIIYIFLWFLTIILLGIPLVFDWWLDMLNTANIDNMMVFLTVIMHWLAIVSVIANVTAIVLTLADRNKKYGLVATCAVMLALSVIFLLMENGIV